MGLVTWECRHKGCGYKRKEQEFLTYCSHQAKDGTEHQLHRAREQEKKP